MIHASEPYIETRVQKCVCGHCSQSALIKIFGPRWTPNWNMEYWLSMNAKVFIKLSFKKRAINLLFGSYYSNIMKKQKKKNISYITKTILFNFFLFLNIESKNIYLFSSSFSLENYPPSIYIINTYCKCPFLCSTKLTTSRRFFEWLFLKFPLHTNKKVKTDAAILVGLFAPKRNWAPWLIHGKLTPFPC